MPLAVAVKVVIVGSVDEEIFSVAFAPWVNPPVPASAELTVSVPALFKVTPVTVTFCMENVPVNVWELTLKVCTPDPVVNVGVVVMPP